MIRRNRSHLPSSKRISLHASGLALGLVAVLLIVSCAPIAPTGTASQPEVISATDTLDSEAAVLTEAPAVVTEAPAVLPVATSRGDALEATDPTMVSLAAGQLQLIEFFRFT